MPFENLPEQNARGRGRPREPELQGRLVSAALEVLATNGIAGLTVERICSRAGVPKATFYRRWAKPFEPVIEGLLSKPRHLLYEDSGDAVRDLFRFYDSLVTLYSDPIWVAWESLSRSEPSIRTSLAVTLVEEGRQRRARNEHALADALARQNLDGTVGADLILNVLNGIARNVSGLDWKTSTARVQCLIRRLVGAEDNGEE